VRHANISFQQAGGHDTRAANQDLQSEDAAWTKLLSKTQKFVWEKEQQHAFEIIKKVISKETLLVYPNFNEPFQIHTDASHQKMGAVISQKGNANSFLVKVTKRCTSLLYNY
jgi:hypothetical protein